MEAIDEQREKAKIPDDFLSTWIHMCSVLSLRLSVT